MSFHATTTVDIYRGETTDSYGDTKDTDSPLYTDKPASIIQQNKTVTNRDTRTPETIRTYTGRVGANVDIQDDDRIRDTKTGDYYLVTGITQNSSPAWTPATQLDLRRIE